MFKHHRLTIAAKLYGVFTLVAIATLFLAATAVYKSVQNTALIRQFESNFIGSQNVERINSLVYAVVMESRGIYMSTDLKTAKRYGDGLVKFNEQITKVVTEWKKSVGPDDAAAFATFEKRGRPVRRIPQRTGPARHPGEPGGRARMGATTTPTAASARRSTRTSPRSRNSTPSARASFTTPWSKIPARPHGCSAASRPSRCC